MAVPAGGGGLLKANFVPPRPIRELRQLTRYRKTQVAERQREANRLHKALEDSNIKLDCVASDLLGVSGRGERGIEPAAALAGTPGALSARGAVVAGALPGPGGQVPGGGEDAHVGGDNWLFVDFGADRMAAVVSAVGCESCCFDRRDCSVEELGAGDAWAGGVDLSLFAGEEGVVSLLLEGVGFAEDGGSAEIGCVPMARRSYAFARVFVPTRIGCARRTCRLSARPSKPPAATTATAHGSAETTSPQAWPRSSATSTTRTSRKGAPGQVSLTPDDPSDELSLKALESGPLHRFSDWPNPDVPGAAFRVYAV
jgi:hypothetical protein